MLGTTPLFTFCFLILAVTAAPQHKRQTCNTTCFPNGNAKISNATATTHTRESWWCPADKLYGFMGFSYPLAEKDCAATSNGFDQINRDFQTMKSMGASMVRIYSPGTLVGS